MGIRRYSCWLYVLFTLFCTFPSPRFIVVVRVCSVKCSERRVVFLVGDSSISISCWDDFNSSLSISGTLPDGLFFENNTVFGTPRSGQERTVYEVTSDADIQSPFLLSIGGKDDPSLLS